MDCTCVAVKADRGLPGPFPADRRFEQAGFAGSGTALPAGSVIGFRIAFGIGPSDLRLLLEARRRSAHGKAAG
jgi:hypothetical protein